MLFVSFIHYSFGLGITFLWVDYDEIILDQGNMLEMSCMLQLVFYFCNVGFYNLISQLGAQEKDATLGDTKAMITDLGKLKTHNFSVLTIFTSLYLALLSSNIGKYFTLTLFILGTFYQQKFWQWEVLPLEIWLCTRILQFDQGKFGIQKYAIFNLLCTT